MQSAFEVLYFVLYVFVFCILLLFLLFSLTINNRYNTIY